MQFVPLLQLFSGGFRHRQCIVVQRVQPAGVRLQILLVGSRLT